MGYDCCDNVPSIHTRICIIQQLAFHFEIGIQLYAKGVGFIIVFHLSKVSENLFENLLFIPDFSSNFMRAHPFPWTQE